MITTYPTGRSIAKGTGIPRMKPSRYARMARTMMQIIKKARTRPYLHKKSNHVYTVWQHLVLLALYQYESKSYRRYVDFLEECAGLQLFLGLSRIPHYTTLQKASARLPHRMLYRIPVSYTHLTLPTKA